MKKLFFFLLLAILGLNVAVAQKETNNWFFGNKAALNFGSGSPVFSPGSALVSAAGSSSISDENGNLLFYTNGVTVWNKNHQPMPNGTGLQGDVNTTQTVLITYHPGNKDLYYIFTVKSGGSFDGFHTYVVDMKLDGGRGDIDPSKTLPPFGLPVSEKLTAVKHKNGRDLWVIVHAYPSDAFFVYAIDCTGLLPFPQVTFIGDFISTLGNTKGYLKASPDGKKLVAANFEGNFDVFDFDNTSGEITNPQTIPGGSGNSCGPYGVEFSPDSKLLYVSESYTCNSPGTFNIYQYRLDADINTTIASKVNLDAGNTNLAGALQLGPDNKIYIAYEGANYLGVINSPNTYGTGCNLAKQGLLSPPAVNGFGLPNVIGGFKRHTLFEDTTVCNGDPLILDVRVPDATYVWSDGTRADSLLVTAPGPYWVEITTTNSNFATCTIRDSINVAFTPRPVFDLGKDTILCQEKFPLLLAPSVPGAGFLWQDSSTNNSFSVKAGGQYWLQATVKGCSSRDYITITSVSGTPFSLGVDTSICPKDSIILKASQPAVAYLWNTGKTTDTIVARTYGIYWCELTYANGCRFRDSIAITPKSLPVFTLGPDTAVCKGKFPLSLLAPAVANASFLWQDSTTASTFSVPGPGSYWLQATVDACSAKDTIDVIENLLPTFDLGADTIICTNGSYQLKVPTPFTSYLWNDGSTSQTLTITTTGKYYCMVTNNTGCSYTDTINVTFNPLPVFSLGSDTTICLNQFPLLLSPAVAGASYLWQGGSTASTFSITADGKYWLQATLNACSYSDTINVKSTAVVAFSLGADTVVCTNDPFVLTVNPAFTNYLWKDGSTARTSKVTTSGWYWCEASKGNGCSYRDSILVSIKQVPVVNLGPDITICLNQLPLLLSQSIAGATYLWQDGTTTSTFSVTADGKYWLQASINGCSASDTIKVDSKAVISFELGADTVVCTNVPFVLTVNPAFSTYTWNTGSTSRSINVTTSGFYLCEASNGTGCSYRDSINVVIKPVPSFTLGKDTTVCQDKFPLLLSQNITGASYLWQDGSMNNSFSVPGAGSYWVEATLNGCSFRDSITVFSSPLPAFSLGADTVICSANPYVLTVSPAFAKYLWSTGSTTRSITVTTGGTYSCEATNSAGCSFTDIVVVKISLPPVINLGKDTVVCGNAFPFTIGNSVTGASYIWQDGSTYSNYSVTTPGTYWVQVSTAIGCSARDSLVVTAATVNTLSLGADTTTCVATPIILTANIAASNYLWSTGSTASSITVTTSGDYWCEINRGTGCSYSDTIRVTFLPPISFSLGNDTLLCGSATLLLNVNNAGTSYLWQDNSQLPQYLVTKAGTYYVTAANSACKKSDTIIVRYNTLLTPDLGIDKTICPGQEILLDPKISATNYLWQDGSTGRNFTVTSPGTYRLQVKNECGTGEDNITITAGDCKLMIPNAFTPGKLPNNLFHVLNPGILKDFKLQVFNRWGQQVYQTSKPTDGWDGKYNGLEQPTGTYVFTVSYTDTVTGKKNSQKGTVILVR